MNASAFSFFDASNVLGSGSDLQIQNGTPAGNPAPGLSAQNLWRTSGATVDPVTSAFLQWHITATSVGFVVNANSIVFDYRVTNAAQSPQFVQLWYALDTVNDASFTSIGGVVTPATNWQTYTSTNSAITVGYGQTIYFRIYGADAQGSNPQMFVDNVSVPIPEPAGAGLAVVGVVGAAIWMRRRKAA